MMWGIQTKERGVPMKTKLSQLVYFANKLTIQHKQLVSFVLLLAVYFVTRAPSDGGTGPF